MATPQVSKFIPFESTTTKSLKPTVKAGNDVVIGSVMTIKNPTSRTFENCKILNIDYGNHTVVADCGKNTKLPAQKGDLMVAPKYTETSSRPESVTKHENTSSEKRETSTVKHQPTQNKEIGLMDRLTATPTFIKYLVKHAITQDTPVPVSNNKAMQNVTTNLLEKDVTSVVDPAKTISTPKHPNTTSEKPETVSKKITYSPEKETAKNEPGVIDKLKSHFFPIIQKSNDPTTRRDI